MQTPAELAARVEVLHDEHGDRMLTARGTSFWREAHCGAQFARLIDAEAIRLAEPPRSDIELRLAGRCQAVELVEALAADRRRNSEIAQEKRIDAALRSERQLTTEDRARARLSHLPQPRSVAERTAAARLREGIELTTEDRMAVAHLLRENGPHLLEDIPSKTDAEEANVVVEALRRAASSKADKGYPSAWWLLIYLNPGFLFSRTAAVVPLFCDATAAASPAFAEVWILWRGQAFQTWRSGQRSVRAERGLLKADQ